MLRAIVFLGALVFIPTVVSAQQPCTNDARRVVDEIYRHMLERPADAASSHHVERLVNGTATVRDLVRDVATSPEHTQRFGQESHDRNVATLYRHLLGRQPDAAGQQGYAQLAASRGLGAVVDDILASSEYAQSFGDWGVPGSGGLRYCGPGGMQVTGTTGMAGEMRFQGMDRNRDGRITRNEWRGSRRSFNEHDWDGDGVLSGDEVRVGARRGARSNEDYDPATDRFEYLDANDNGRVDRNEWKGNLDVFDRLDVNNDAMLSRSEIANARPADRFASLDWNNDGEISLDEWYWSRRSFDQQDVDGDGVLTRGEFRGGGVPTSGFFF